ncbi:MAG: serine/threonine-protein kinase [Gemmatimonadota bacterium]
MDPQLDRLRAAFAGRYEIDREAGAGGMATVYLARDLKHDRLVAIKVLRPELAAALGPDRFPREISILAKLQHPHILPLHDSGELDGFLYYVMPFVEGESLRTKLDREGELPVPDAIKILREVADALAYAHALGVMHRDIKPDNVMLSGRHAMVMDFGVAKAVSTAGGDSLTTVGVAVGTPSYMSPEQATGQGNVDQRSDIYALGILGYEMLSGNTPFSGRSAQAILSAHVVETPTHLTLRRASVPQPLADLLMRCLEKAPADRWQKAEEVLAQLEAIGTPGSGGITPTHTRPMSGTTARLAVPARRRLLFGLIAVAVLLGASVGGWKLLGASERIGFDRLAVMPITDVSGADTDLVRAMHNQLIVALGKLRGVTVAPSSAVEGYRSAPAPAAEVAEALHVGALLEANVFRAGQRLRVTVQLTDPRTVEQIWSDSYDIDLSGDLFDAIDGVIPRIVTGVGAAVGGSRAPN